MITRECRKPKEAYKIATMATLMAGAVCLTVYSHFILKTGKVFTHLFYVPIILSSIWWGKKGLVVAVFLGATVIASSVVFLEADLRNNLVRVFAFMLISSMVLFLVEQIAKKEKKPKECSHNLEKLLEKRTDELRNAQEQLARKDRLAKAGQLAGSISHELRTPLTVIADAIYYLKTIQPDTDCRVKKYLDIISSEVRNAERIISDFLDLFRTKQKEAGKASVSELVAQTLSRQSPPDNVEVVTDIPSDPLSVMVDEGQIIQVLANLFSNAYQAMPEGGILTVRAEDGDKTVMLSVADTGTGIAERDTEKIFEPLFASRPHGIGLGLAVSRDLVNSNWGDITVRSEEGVGSTFIVTLPAAGQE